MLDYIDKKYSMRKTFMCGAMKPVSLLFDQPTYVRPFESSENIQRKEKGSDSFVRKYI